LIPDDPFYAALLWGGIACVLAAVAGGLLTRLTPWYFNLRKPSWKPPDWAFGPIWTGIFILIALAIAFAWAAASPEWQPRILIALAVNLVLNISWSAFFFTMQRPDLAMIELVAFWISIVALIYVFAQASALAAILLLPYLAWVTAAGFLNYRILELNRA
jgi:translocator protein